MSFEDKIVPLPPVDQFVKLPSGLTLHYYDRGAGVPVVFLHGAGPGAGAWANFSQNFPAFERAGVRCIGVDMPGFGHSDKPEDLLYNDDTFDRTLLEFFDAIDLSSAILLGNSLGGAISLRFALDHPSRVRGLILMAPGGVEERETYFQMTGVQTMVQTFQAGPMDLAAMRKVMSLQMFNPDRIPTGLLEQRVEVAKLQPSTLFSTMRVANMTPRLSEIQCPILGFWGVNDQFNPHTGSLKITQACAHTRFVLLSQCGHWVMLEHQDTFERECLSFVKEVAER
ncbi:MAG: hypothetical protein RJA77_166 [Pseudomonadota bacterium]|jgi:4,5:9,10-diseco-3-hydroxy-5,9,17-trioxoandrosta-1(10),2-diene-4-oate hydrolase